MRGETTDVQLVDPPGPLRRPRPALRKPKRRARGVSVGTVVRLGDGVVFVRKAGSGRDVAARTVVPMSAADVGREVVIAFERGDPRRAIVMGRLCTNDAPAEVDLVVDGKSVAVTGEREVSLRCGKASITLTRAGKVLIRGTYVLSRSSGANRIKGGAVQIN